MTSPRTEPPLTRWAWLCAATGMAGAVLVAYATPRALADPVVRWWYTPASPSPHASLVLVYAGMVAIACAWLGLGRSLPSQRALLVIAGAWALPLALEPPLFSRDVYSYLAQGTILHLGHSPYHSAPTVLAGLRRSHVLDAVSPFWRHTTAPYGPLFLGIVSLIVGAVKSHLVAGVLLIRLVDLAGLVLLARAIPRLAGALGTDPRRALWLALLSPLVMLELVAAGHNDLLMVGLLAAGVATALDGRPLQGIALCALAATIKLPALAGVLFISVAWARAERERSAQAAFTAAAAVVTVAVLGAVTVITGVGVSWLSSSVFSTPAKVHLAITPATAIGYTLHSLLGDVGIVTSAHGVEDAVGKVAFALAAAAGLVMLVRVRVPTAVTLLGGALLVFAAGGPAAWPWYFVWGLGLLAASPPAQRSAALAVAIAASAFVVKPDGILLLSVHAAPVVLLVYIAAAAAALSARRRRRRGRDAHGPGDGGTGRPGAATVHEQAASALAGT